PPPPPPPPPPPLPPGLPAPADLDTADHGQAGIPETGDEILFTFSGAVDPALIIAGWDGSATAVTVHIEGPARNDVLTVLDPSDGSVLSELGSVQTNRDYADSADFTGSQMSLSGDTITIVLGTVTGTTRRDPAAKELVWTTPQGAVAESGGPDSDF
ncbi:MAG TPA: hypothetical protein VLD13_03880, partial [Gaiellaceae bacterium]|nr:hypothetical protein [Gaiellaceae bacterium]